MEEEADIYGGRIFDPVGFNTVVPPQMVYVKSRRSGMTNLVFTPITEADPMTDAIVMDTFIAANVDPQVGRLLTDLLVSRYGSSFLPGDGRIGRGVPTNKGLKAMMEAMGFELQNDEQPPTRRKKADKQRRIVKADETGSTEQQSDSGPDSTNE